ncbi:hypothetical protein DFJ73DRAFT_810830 [Zopfochytrium polystomum]|nr:hypothetical protein DFJ73DRAFT_810830 [Zopfochytrium polystomum]
MAPPGSAAGRGADGDGPTTLAAADSKDSSTPQQPNDQSLTQTDNNDENYYDRSSFLPADASGKLMPQDLLRLHCSFGFDSNKRANLHLMDESTLLTSVGNVLTMEQTYHQGVRDGGVGAIAVHPTRKYIAVAEVYFAAPAIFIFEYPTMEIVRVLRAGATKGYS